MCTWRSPEYQPAAGRSAIRRSVKVTGFGGSFRFGAASVSVRDSAAYSSPLVTSTVTSPDGTHDDRAPVRVEVADLEGALVPVEVVIGVAQRVARGPRSARPR